MHEIQTTRTERIKALHAEILGAMRMTLEKAIEVGGLLEEQKADIPHGQWSRWIADNLPFDIRTAQRYMKAYENREQIKNDMLSSLTEAYRMLENTGPGDDACRDSGKIFVLLLMYTWWYMIPDAEQDSAVAELREKAERISTYGPAYDPELCWGMHQDENPYLRMTLPHHKYVSAYEAWESGKEPDGWSLIMLGWTEEEFERRLVRGEQFVEV